MQATPRNQLSNLECSGHGGGLHSSPTLSAARERIAIISGSDSGIATAGAAAQLNILLQKALAHPPMQQSTSGRREERQGYCWYTPCRGPSTFHWQLNWLRSARGAMVPQGLVPWRVCHHCNPQTTRATA